MGCCADIGTPTTPGAGSVDDGQLADMPEGTTKGRAAGAGTGSPANLTAAQMRRNVDQPHVATAAPQSTDNASAGYAAGDLWYSSLSNILFVCAFADENTATWLPTAVFPSAIAPTVNDDIDNGFSFGSLWFELGTKYRLWVCTSPQPAGSADWRSFVKTSVVAGAPTVNNDSTCGYSVGDGWLDTTTAPPLLYICHSNANGAADWQPERQTVPVVDPGNTKAIPVHRGMSVQLVSVGAGETRTIAGPSFDGQRMLLHQRTHAGNIAITASQAINTTGNTTMTFTATGQALELVGINDNGTPKWRVAWNDGVTLS